VASLSRFRRAPDPAPARPDRSQQSESLNGFCQEVDSSCLERAYGARHVAVSVNEHDLRVMFDGDLALQIQAVDVRELYVQDEARRQLGFANARYSAPDPNVTTFNSAAVSSSWSASRMRASSSTTSTM